MKKTLFGLIFIIFMFSGCLKQVSPSISAKQTSTQIPTPSIEVKKFIDTYDLKVVDIKYVQNFINNDINETKNFILIDASSLEQYKKRTIPSSINLPIASFNKSYAKFKNIAKDSNIVLFCADENCTDSANVAKLLKDKGYVDTKLFLGGLNQWKKRDYTQVGTDVIKNAIKDNSAFLIDVRAHKRCMTFNIIGSICMPSKDFMKLNGRLPADKNTTIVLFSDDDSSKDVHKIAKSLLGRSYSDVSVYDKGFSIRFNKKSRLKKVKKNVKKTEKKSKVSPFLGPIKKGKDIGAVDGKWFVKNYQHFLDDIVMVDIRRENERSLGFVKGSIHVSFEENSSDIFMEKLPKDSYVVLISLTGALSKKAYEFLKAHDYDNIDHVLYLDANIKCKDNDCMISPNRPLNPTIW